MKRRGRPPHPDILTPREWEVLDLLRNGLSNPEIAERLGVSRDAVKYHVSEILSKLGVASREEAAVWRPYQRPWWAAALSALGGAASRLSPLGRIAAIGASVVLLAGLGLLAWGVWATSSDRSESPGSTAGDAAEITTDEATASGTAAPPPQFLAGKDVIAIEIGPEMEFPEHTALIAALGCAPCGSPAHGLVRVYRDSSGSVRIDDLLKIETLGLPPRIVGSSENETEVPPLVAGMAVNTDGSEMYVSVCTGRGCATVDGPAFDSESTILHSLDGGISWQRVGQVRGLAYLGGIVNETSVLIASVEQGKPSLTFSLFPGGELVTPPVSDRTIWPIVLSSGEILWNVEQRSVLRSDGSLYLDASGTQGPEIAPRVAVLSESGGSTAIGLIQYEGPGFADSYLLELAAGSTELAFSFDGQLTAGVWSEEGLIFGNTSLRPEDLPGQAIPFRGLPAVIDVDNRSVNPILGPFLGEPFINASVGILAVQQGPFARVVNTGADCLNIRAEPASGGEALNCAAEGVLLRDLGPTAEAEDVTWTRVRTPAGIEGWASTQYLER